MGITMGRLTRALLAAFLLASTMSVGADTGVIHAATSVEDGTPSQKYLDVVAARNDYAGLWGDVTGGVNGRPFVTDLSVTVTPADGSAEVTQKFITGGTVATPGSSTPGDITMTITPYNVCNKARGDQPAAGQCYADPNRLGGLIGYVKGETNVGFNFSNPTDTTGRPLNTPLLDLIKNPLNKTVFDATVNMNMWGKYLRWTWMNGLPTFWNVNPVADANSLVHMKFQMQTGPSELCDTRIPVDSCDPSQRGANFAPTKVLRTNFVFSLDSTGVDQVFAGSLFASSNADMGSLEAAPVGSPVLALTYGVIGSNELGGEANVAKFWAFVSDSSLVNYFGTTQDVLDSPEFAGSQTLKVTRADGGTSEETAWTRWTSDSNGTPGYFLSVTGVRFDGKAVSSQSAGASGLAPTKAAKWTMGKKPGNTVSIRASGTRQVLSMSSTNPTCKKYVCRWVVSRSESKVNASTKKLASVATLRGTSRAAVSVAAKKGTVLSVMLQAKKSGKWTFLTSRTVVGK